LVLAVLAHQ
jgi:hypothetical protein